jgi:hypothetical protein
VSFKILTNTAMLRLNYVADHVVRLAQNTFMEGRDILDGVVILPETVEEIHRKKKKNGVILKFGF